MKLVKCLKEFGCWAKKGKIVQINNNLAYAMERRDIIEIIKDLGHYNESPYFLKKSIASMKVQIKILEDKIKTYEKKMEKG